MKVLILLFTLFVGLSCSHRPVSRSPQSVGLPVVKIVANSSGALEVNPGESIKVKFTLYDSLSSPVVGKVVNFYFSGSSGHFQNTQATSNYNGEVENIFIAHESAQESNKRINYELYVERPFIGRLTSTQFLTIKADPKIMLIKKFNSISLVTSSFEWAGDKNPVADPSKEYSLAFIPKDQAGTLIKSDGKFQVSFIVDGEALAATFFTDQTYRLKVPGPSVFGKKIYKLEIRNGINETIHSVPEFLAEFKPVIKLDEMKIVKNEHDKKTFEVAFSVIDINGKIITADYLSDFSVTDEVDKKVELTKEADLYLVKGEFPYGKGKKQLRFHTSKEKMLVVIELPYNNLELAWDKIEFKLDKSYLHPFFVRPAVYNIYQEMESTGFTLKLIDIKGNPLENLADMNLSLETKIGRGVFSPLKVIAPGEFRGVFSPENNDQGKIIFSLKGGGIEKELSSELKVGFVPQKDLIKKTVDWSSSAYSDELSVELTEDENGQSMIDGFTFANEGVNPIVLKGAACDSDPQDKMQASRTYSFHFDSQSRQGIRLYVRDDTSSWDSKNRHSSFYFFPRKFIPFFKKLSKESLEVTLPTGEIFTINRQSGEFLSKNVLEEFPIDMGTGYPNCPVSKGITKRSPDITYKGKGVMLKVSNPTGSSMPEHPAREVSAQVYYHDELTGKQVHCHKLLKTDFFTNGVLKFTSDEELAKFLKMKCGEAFSKRITAY